MDGEMEMERLLKMLPDSGMSLDMDMESLGNGMGMTLDGVCSEWTWPEESMGGVGVGVF